MSTNQSDRGEGVAGSGCSTQSQDPVLTIEQECVVLNTQLQDLAERLDDQDMTTVLVSTLKGVKDVVEQKGLDWNTIISGVSGTTAEQVAATPEFTAAPSTDKIVSLQRMTAANLISALGGFKASVATKPGTFKKPELFSNLLSTHFFSPDSTERLKALVKEHTTRIQSAQTSLGNYKATWTNLPPLLRRLLIAGSVISQGHSELGHYDTIRFIYIGLQYTRDRFELRRVLKDEPTSAVGRPLVQFFEPQRTRGMNMDTAVNTYLLQEEPNWTNTLRMRNSTSRWKGVADFADLLGCEGLLVLMKPKAGFNVFANINGQTAQPLADELKAHFGPALEALAPLMKRVVEPILYHQEMPSMVITVDPDGPTTEIDGLIETFSDEEETEDEEMEEEGTEDEEMEGEAGDAGEEGSEEEGSEVIDLMDLDGEAL